MRHTSKIIWLVVGLGILSLNSFFSTTAHADCVTPPAGIVGWWPAEGNANDVVAGGSDGMLINGTGFTNGEVGAAFNLNGVDNFVLIQTTSTNLDVGKGGGFTIEGWIKPESESSGIIAAYEGAIGGSTSDLGIQFYASDGGSLNLLCNMYDTDGGLHQFNTAPDVLSAGIWQHVALTYDKSSGSACLYVNGVASTEVNLGSFTPQTSFTNLVIGARTVYASGAAPEDVFQGAIDELSIYSRALSSNEIAAIYDAGTNGKCSDVPPTVTTPPTNQTAKEGGNVELSVVAGVIGPFGYQWIFNGTSLSGATNDTLTLTNLHPGQAGNYQVIITNSYGAITSSIATVTVVAQTILAYTYTGSEKVITTGVETTVKFSGQMFFIPAMTNGVFVGWNTVAGKKTYWVSPFSNYLLVTIPGSANHAYTVLGEAGQEIDTNNYPHIWSYLHLGLNTQLTVGSGQTFFFPKTFACNETHVFPDSRNGNMVLTEASSTYTFSPATTQAANNKGQTMADLVNALTQSLIKQGYQTQ